MQGVMGNTNKYEPQCVERCLKSVYLGSTWVNMWGSCFTEAALQALAPHVFKDRLAQWFFVMQGQFSARGHLAMLRDALDCYNGGIGGAMASGG